MTKRPYDAIDYEPSSSDMERLTLRDQNADYDVMDDSDHMHKSDLLSHIFDNTGFSRLDLEPDRTSRPLWISPDDGNIILETFSPNAEQAQNFLPAIAELVSRQALMHEYKITASSLYAAASVGLQTADIIKVLDQFSKVPIPETVANFIKGRTMSYGKVKLVLKHNKYYVESNHPEILQMLSKDPAISASMKKPSDVKGVGMPISVFKSPQCGIPGRTPEVDKTKDADGASKTTGAELFTAVIRVENDDGEDIDEEDENAHAFEIDGLKIDDVKKRCNELNYPMLEEYDFRNNTKNPNLDIDLKPTTVIRPHQEKSLSRVFANGRARSGIIMLPRGAGKTLVGIAAACIVKKSCLILCTSSDSVMQWKSQFMKWSNVKGKQIAVFTVEHKETLFEKSGIVIATYSMVARSNRSQYITSRKWFVILDEVQAAPAAMFRRALTVVKAHSKLGLTSNATFPFPALRFEDDKIVNLNYMIGPKLYEANWQDLAAKGYIPSLQCAEVWCPMTPEFYREYLRLEGQSRKRKLFHCMNPRKFQACQFLIQYHEKRGDKIIVFSDNAYTLEAYAKKLGKLFVHEKTQQVERTRIWKRFQDSEVKTIFISKIGDTSIDLPEATCLIQISSHFSSWSQEAQHLGSLLRAKWKDGADFNAFFYSLVSKDTQEMSYSTKRQQFLIDQGYPSKVITHLDGMDSLPDLVYKTRDQQMELFSVLLENESEAEPGPVRGAVTNKKPRKQPQRIFDTDSRYFTTLFEK